MNNKNLSLGVFLLSIGIIWALVNTGVISWGVLSSLFTLWPLLIVMLGVNMIFRNNQAVKALGWVAFLSVVVIYGFYGQSRVNELADRDGDKVAIEKRAETKTGELRLDLGGVSLDVNSGTSNLIDAVITDPYTKHSVDYKRSGEAAEIRFKKENSFNFYPKMLQRAASLNLNRDIVWDLIDLNVGAISGTVDMSQLEVRKVDLDMGAGNIELILGNRAKAADVNIDAGASQITVAVPFDAGVKVHFDGAMNATNLDSLGWEKQSDKFYLSPDYDSAEVKINMDVDMGVGKFDVVVR